MRERMLSAEAMICSAASAKAEIIITFVNKNLFRLERYDEFGGVVEQVGHFRPTEAHIQYVVIRKGRIQILPQAYA